MTTKDKQIEFSKKKLSKREFFLALIEPTIVTLIVAATIGITWGFPMLWSTGATAKPSIPLDDKIPLLTGFVWFYYLTFVLGIISIYVMYFKNRKAMYDVVLTIIFAFFVSMIFYFAWQTEFIKPALEPNSLSDKMVLWTWASCRPVNCLPSQHCFMAIACILAGAFEKKAHWAWRTFTIFCGIMIILSTMFIKQHYFLDFVASLVIMAIFFVVVYFTRLGERTLNAVDKFKDKHFVKK